MYSYSTYTLGVWTPLCHHQVLVLENYVHLLNTLTRRRNRLSPRLKGRRLLWNGCYLSTYEYVWGTAQQTVLTARILYLNISD